MRFTFDKNMKKLALITVAAILWITTGAYADLIKLGSLGEDESVEVNVHQEGTIMLHTRYTFTADKVVVTQSGKKLGEVVLTAAERIKIDRFLDQVRDGRFGRGNGSTTFVIKFMRRGKERRSMAEDYKRIGIGYAKGEVLSLDDLKDRVSK